MVIKSTATFCASAAAAGVDGASDVYVDGVSCIGAAVWCEIELEAFKIYMAMSIWDSAPTRV